MRPGVNFVSNAMEPLEVLLRPTIRGSHHDRVPTGYSDTTRGERG